ncbi:MAG TPA: DUF2911 domain-containing protein [Blastocatellia bacterium]|nr:DUF2911 domain-containing protein [Blastocatellia bacterium]
MKLYALIALFSLISAVSCFGNTANAPSQGDDRGHPVLELAGNKIEVNHGRPTLRGRNPEAMIQPGQVWRMGANDPTTLSTQGDLKFGDKVIPAGTYVLQAKLVEAKKWNLLIQSEAGSTVAEVPFSLQTTDKSVEALTITLEKKDKGGRMILTWGTLALSADFQSVPKSVSAADNEKWNELTAFHAVMSATFHPMEEGNFKPIRSRAAELAAKAKQWSDSTPPALYDKAEIKTNVAKLAQESQALAALVSKKASDGQVRVFERVA